MLSEMDADDLKNFYKGVLVIKSDPARAYAIFSDLHRRFATYAGIAMNRMAAKVNWAQSDDNSVFYHEALEEWKQVEGNFSKENLEGLEPHLSVNLMHIFYKLDEFDLLDRRYYNLPLLYQMQPDILKIRIEALKNRRIDEGIQLLKEARNYHQYGGITENLFLEELETIVHGTDDIEILRYYFNRIFDSSPGKMIVVLPEWLNGKTDVAAFLVKEVVDAADRMLEKVKALDNIRDENKYSDIVEVVLNARLTYLRWNVGSQSRGGYAHPSGGGVPIQPGERDLTIRDANGKSLLVIEAFILRNAAETHKHLKKVFNYDHKRNEFLILIYDTHENGDDFKANWKKYKEETVLATVFPAGYGLDGIVEDVTADFGSSLCSIMIGKSRHKNGSILFHVMVDIHYRVT